MPEESEHFRCVLCGQHAPVERLKEGPYSLEMFLKTLGGKRKLTEEEREARKGLGPFGRGSAPGRLDYEEIPVTDEVRAQVDERISQLSQHIEISDNNT